MKTTDYKPMAEQLEDLAVGKEPTAYGRMMDISVKVPYIDGVDMTEVENRLAAYARTILLLQQGQTKRTMERQKSMTLEEAESYLDSIVQKEHHFVPEGLNGMRDIPNRKYM